ncbi:MAG: hypothetical protein HYW90_00605 [Candidatus Sungbacteria bacterium]|nr:hypothetical protein [Parcubacteria group bacterium]MBI2639382.1 hypothetical protein [Candidatus Sungbacteria bacterium]
MLKSKNEEVVKEFYALKKQLDLLLEDRQNTWGYLQNYLYFTYIPVFNYTEAIIILCNSGKYNAASVLLRSLFEAHINIIYHQVGDSEKKLATSVSTQLAEFRRSFEGVSKLIEEHPSLVSVDEKSLFNQKYLKKAFNKIDSDLAKLSLSNKPVDGKKRIRLIDKAKDCDDAKIFSIQVGHFQRMYHVIYRQLSPAVHLDIGGLDSFVDKSGDGRFFTREMYNGDILIIQAIEICVALVKDLYEHGVLKEDISRTVNNVENLIGKSSAYE